MPSKSRQTFSGLLSRFMPAAHGFVEPRQLVVRNQLAGVFHQIAPNRKRPGLQRNLRAFSPQTFVRRIERETAEPLPGKSDPSAGTMRPPAALCRRISPARRLQPEERLEKTWEARLHKQPMPV